MAVREVTHVTFITLERVCLSWRVSPESPNTVSSLSSISVIIQFCFKISVHQSDGGCHVILLKWRTGAEHLAVVSAHAGWPTHVHTPAMVVTVKTAVSSLTGHIFQLDSSGLRMLPAARKVTTHWGNWSAMVQRKCRLRIKFRKWLKFYIYLMPRWDPFLDETVKRDLLLYFNGKSLLTS